MTRPEAARLVRERWERLLGMSPEEAPRVFSSDVDNMLAESGEAINQALEVQFGAVAQGKTGEITSTAEQEPSKLRVAGSNPASPSNVADQGRGTTPSTESITVGDSGVSTSARVDAPGIHSSLDHFTNRITRYVDKKLGHKAETERIAL
jgi:hypothetical protein